MMIETVQTTDRFFELRDEWNGLLASSASDCVFLTHEWLFTWWKHLGEGRRLYIITVRENGTLVGILPLALRSAQYSRMMPRVLEFLGSGVIGSDYLDVIAMRGKESDVVQALARELHRAGYMLQLSQLKRGACVAAMLAETLSGNRWSANDAQMNVCPYIDLTGHTWDSWMATLGSSQRYNFNRRLRNLVKTTGMRFDCVRAPEAARENLETIISLHRKRWGSVGASEAFQTLAVVEFHHDFADLAARRGWLRLMVLRTNDGTPVAGLYGLRYGPTFSFYQSGFDPAFSKQSVGLVMMGLAIKSAIEERASEYDFLHGDEEYKFHWTSKTRELGRIELYPPHSRGSVYRHAITLNRAARQMAKRVLKKANGDV